MSKKHQISAKRFDLMPRHIAIIMDGNGRWAKKRGLPRIAGHWAGAEALRRILEHCSKIGIKILTVYAFSSENWKRPFQEVNTILNLLLYYLKVETENLHRNHVKIIISGNWNELQENIVAELERCVELTENNTGIVFNIALNYGSRKEILDACKEYCNNVIAGNIKLDDIDEGSFSRYLYAPEIPDPDLLIRPSGEKRISNFLLWQIAYSELWFTDTLWPDFTPDDLAKAMDDFSKRDRRFGGIKS